MFKCLNIPFPATLLSCQSKDATVLVEKSSGAWCSKHLLMAVLFTTLCQPIKDREVGTSPGGSIYRMMSLLCVSPLQSSFMM